MGIIAKNICKTVGSPPIKILTDINLEIHEGEFVALTGRSGSGKSTLLYILSSLDAPSEGTVMIDNQNINKVNGKQISQFRNEKMGFVFQFHYLINELSVIDNVLLPTKKAGQQSERKEYAEHLLEQFSLANKMWRLPRELSGGEQQRVAIARSLIMKPKYIFADEPTGNLDSINGELVMNIFQNTRKSNNTTIIMVTHDSGFANLAERQIRLADGRIID